VIASKKSDLKKTDWEIDFYSRPIIDENGKKRWELLITSTNNLKIRKHLNGKRYVQHQVLILFG